MIVFEHHYQSLNATKRCEPLIAFTKVAQDGNLYPHKIPTPVLGASIALLWVRGIPHGNTSLIISSFIFPKVSWAFGKREIIANAALINMSLLQRVSPLHVSKVSKS